MSRSDEQRVRDILDAFDQILDVVKDGRDAWDKDRIRQLAVERLLEIIGESANSLTDGFRGQYPDIPISRGATSLACASCSRTTTTEWTRLGLWGATSTWPGTACAPKAPVS